jgi:hypothetical protein
MERLLQQQQQQQQCVALPDVLQLAIAHIKLWQQIIDFTIWSSSGRQTILSGSTDLLLAVQPAARLAAAVLVAVPRGCVAWQGALAVGDVVIQALSKEMQDIDSDPARIPVPGSTAAAAAAAAAAAESGSSKAPQQQQQH